MDESIVRLPYEAAHKSIYYYIIQANEKKYQNHFLNEKSKKTIKKSIDFSMDFGVDNRILKSSSPEHEQKNHPASKKAEAGYLPFMHKKDIFVFSVERVEPSETSEIFA